VVCGNGRPTTPLSDVPISHYVSIDGPQRKAYIDTKLMKFIADPGKYIGGDVLTNWLGDKKAREKLRVQQQSLKYTSARQLLANNPYYRDPDLRSFNNPYYDTLVDSSGNQIMPTIPDTLIGVSFGNWDTLQVVGNERWLRADIKAFGSVIDEVFFTVSTSNDWGQPGSKFPLSFTEDDALYNYPNFPERRPTFIPIWSAMARDQSDPPVFDIEITSDTRGFHDELPYDVMLRLLYHIGMFHPTSVSANGDRLVALNHPGYYEAFASGGTGYGYEYEWSFKEKCDDDPPPISPWLYTCNEWHYAGSGKSISFSEPRQNAGPVTLRVRVKDKKVSNDESYWSYAYVGDIYWHDPNDDRGPRGKTLSIDNYPNPFNPTTEINLQVPETMHVSVNVYDLLGRKVSTVIDSELTSGRHRITFDASFLATGTYFYVLNTDKGDRITRRLMLIK